MLRNLHIENIAVVERADVEFAGGLNVLTGETGAGKSIVIDSLLALTGARIGRELVRTGADKALVSGIFDPEEAEAWCTENDIDLSDGELIIQRSVTAEGRGGCRINGVPVSVAQLRDLASHLLDIHGQNDGRLLLDENRHGTYLDSFAGLDKSAYVNAYKAWKDNENEIRRLSLDDETRARLAETLRYRVEELEKAQLKPGEEPELEARSQLLGNAERLRESTDTAYAALYGAEENALILCSAAMGELERACRWSEELTAAKVSLKEGIALLTDAAERLRDYRDTLDFSPEEFDRVEGRISLLRRLEKKFNATDADALLALLEESRERLEEIEFSSDKLELLQKKGDQLRRVCVEEAKKLTELRQSAAKALSERVRSELKDLSMPSVRFETEITEAELGPEGADSVRFLMSANAGEEPGRIARIASGGELSRIMLALKTVFGEKDPVPVSVFDEIDTGVSGVAASRVAEKLSKISRGKQVLCVSHLPQIAAMADAQYRIHKEERSGRTYTEVDELDGEGRTRELARLIGGDNVTEVTLSAAAEQIAAAERFKTNK